MEEQEYKSNIPWFDDREFYDDPDEESMTQEEEDAEWQIERNKPSVFEIYKKEQDDD